MKAICSLLLSIFTSVILAQAPRLVAPIGHIGGVEAIAFSPNGKYVLTGSIDHTAKLWDLKGHEIQTFSGHTQAVNSVAFSPDGKFVFTGSRDSTAILWDLYGKVIQTFTGHKKLIESVAFSPNGKQVLTGGRDDKAILWDLDGEIIQKFKGHDKDINSVAFSPDGKQVLTSSKDSTAILWDLDGNILQTYRGHKGKVKYAEFSPDGKRILTSSDDNTAMLWSLDGKMLQAFVGHPDQVNMAVFSPDGKFVLTGSHDLTAKLWDLQGTILRTYEGRHSAIPTRITVAFSPNGKLILTGSKDGSAKLWTLDGRELQTFAGHAEGICSVAFSSADGGKQLLTGHVSGTAKWWNLPDREIRSLQEHTDWVTSLAFSPSADEQLILTGSKDYTAKLWDRHGKAIFTFVPPDAVSAVAFSPDGSQLLTGSGTEAMLWETSGISKKTFTDDESIINAVAFSPDGKLVLTGMAMEAKLWGADGNEIQTFTGHESWVTAVAFSPDRKQILTGSNDKTAKLWSLNGQLIQTISGHTKGISTVAYSPDGKQILTGSFDNSARLWDLNGKLLHRFEGHGLEIYSAVFSPNGKFVLTGSLDNTAKIWDVAKGKELATLMAIDSIDWVVTSPSGLFDASPGAMNLMHFIAGLEVIELEQLKERYYEPGLLSKLLGQSQDPFRSVENFKEVALYPEMSATLSADSLKLHVELTARNGGIGKLSVFVNGKEVEEDANPNGTSSLTLELNKYSRYYQPNSINQLALRVYNQAGWLKSQALELDYTPPAPKAEKKNSLTLRKKPGLYAVVIGTSNYAGDHLDLQFADRDAGSFSQALRAAAPKVFDGRVYVTLLNTDEKDPNRQGISSKANIREAFEAIAEKAQVQDVLLIYCSGHGVNYGLAENSQFYYLTKDIGSEILSDPDIRDNYTISSNEFTQFIKAIPAQKQVMILDACNSGKIVDDLAAGRKDLSATQVRALDRMKDRTGMFILTGSAADKVSYEASEFGQGLLTYTLLQGMSGLALSEDKRVDVMTLFQYARDQVPDLAKGIGGIQTPVLAFPSSGASFDIGLVDEPGLIQLESARPVFIRNDISDDSFGDPLQLTKHLEDYFRQQTAKGAQAELIYVDVREYQNAYSIRGRYHINGNDVELEAGLLKGGVLKGKFVVKGKKDAVPELVEKILEEVSGLL